MIIYYNSKETFKQGDKVQLKAFTQVFLQQENAKDQIKLELKDPEFCTYALSIRSKIFDPCCIEHLTMLLKKNEKIIKLAKMQDTKNNSAVMLSKKGGLHKTLIQLGFLALYFYEDHQTHMLLLDEMELEVLRVDLFRYKKKALNINFNNN